MTPSDDRNSTFMWGKNDVNRDKSGKLLPRRWLLGGPADGGGVGGVEKTEEGEDKYISIADKMTQSEPYPRRRRDSELE